MRSKQSTSWKYGVDICKQLGILRPTQLLRTIFIACTSVVDVVKAAEIWYFFLFGCLCLCPV